MIGNITKTEHQKIITGLSHAMSGRWDALGLACDVNTGVRAA